jgi:DNA topoisomerase-1
MAEKKALVIVESPTKANTIRKFLPKSFIVESSYGHIRDLPQSAADIPASLKKSEWSKLGVNVEEDFDPLYIIPKDKTKRVKDLKELIKKVDELYLATDEDREGESISWHLLEILKPKIPVKRMVFHEITKKAILDALAKTRKVDMSLVKAQETRRILDRLYGYTLSPLIWKKIAFGLSAGRVQSTGLRMIVERERERILFKKSHYCSLKAILLNDQKQKVESRLIITAGKKIATGKDFDERTGNLIADKAKNIVVLNLDNATKLATSLKSKIFLVQSVDEKDVFSQPSAPFITSTLQQEANRKLNLSARDSMRVAQKLYEEGLITYMRTDSPSLSSQAIEAARESVAKLYGKEFLSKEVRQYSAKSASAQEAHEAIRPAGQSFVHPDETGLTGKEKALYELIWKRTLATQMEKAHKRSMTVKITCDDNEFTANGLRIVFPGFLRVYVEGSDDPEAALEDQDVVLPKLAVGEKLKADVLEPLTHETKPPARFTEASIIQRLEKEGIGRPSTYASIISTVIERKYVRKEGSALVPTLTGIAVIQLLEKNFADLVDYSFTSGMEDFLDKIAEGEKDPISYLKEFYLGAKGLKQKVDGQDKKIKADEGRTIILPQLDENILVKIGRYGPYVVSKDKKSKEEVHASIPEDTAPADLTTEKLQSLLDMSKKGPEPIGVDPKTKKNVYCLVGRYGAYVQLGEKTDAEPSPKRASLPNGMDPKTISLDQALHLLKLPRNLGVHPVTGKEILANAGKFGPYVVHAGDFRSLGKLYDVYEITLQQAIDLLSQPKVSSRGASLFKELGQHPKDNKKINVYDGKYGLFIKHGIKNVAIPDELRKPEIVSKWDIKDALKLIDSKKS